MREDLPMTVVAGVGLVAGLAGAIVLTISLPRLLRKLSTWNGADRKDFDRYNRLTLMRLLLLLIAFALQFIALLSDT